jgi:hypothetical protein
LFHPMLLNAKTRVSHKSAGFLLCYRISGTRMTCGKIDGTFVGTRLNPQPQVPTCP